MLSSKSTGDALLGKSSSDSNQEPFLGGRRKSNAPIQSSDINIRQQIPQQVKKSEASPEKKKKNKKPQAQFTYILKVFNILLGLMLVAYGGFCYYDFNQDAQSKNALYLIGYILPGYIAFSGLIILTIEMHIEFIVRNMKFFYNYFGRGFFNIYVGIMPLTLIDTSDSSTQTTEFQVLTYVMVSLVLFIGVLYILAKICCCAKQGQKRKKRRQQQSSSDQQSDQ